jgi:hypothetical protein
MKNPAEIAERYIEAFNETDAGRRLELVRSLFVDDGTYTDPQVAVQGTAEIDGFIAQTQSHFPGFTFSLGGPVDAHHDQMRFQWHAGPAEDHDQFVGFDVIVMDDGRIRDVYGFMDAAPAA